MIDEVRQKERLDKFKINIKTKYKSGEMILERNTDNSKNDNISEGIILEKDYYFKGQIIKKENVFDSRISYTYVFDSQEDIVCVNCGMIGNVLEFTSGCPYCGTSYNLDFKDKELGSKHYYDLVIKDRSYIKKTFIIDFVFSFFISFIYIKTTSRTFYVFDLMKVIGLTLLIGLILFYLFYYLDAMIIMPSVRQKKEELNKKQQDFFERMKEFNIEKNKFYNNLGYDLRKYYYSEENPYVIDFDIIDYNSFIEEKIDNELFISVNVDIRIVNFIDGRVISRVENKTYKFKQAHLDKKLDGSINSIKCHNCGAALDITNDRCDYCGAALDITNDRCDYCGAKFNYYQEWYLVEVV